MTPNDLDDSGGHPHPLEHGINSVGEMMVAARRIDAVDLVAGAPDEACDEMLKAAAMSALSNNWDQYSPPGGLRSLCDQIVLRLETLGVISLDPKDVSVCITCGATEAFLAAVLAFVNAGEEVVLFEPFYDAHVRTLRLCSATPKFVRLSTSDWTFDESDLRRALSSGAVRALVLNSPHNPTGKIFTFDEINTISRLCANLGVLIISDEVYSEIYFNETRPVSAFSLTSVGGQCISISSASKTYGVTGWRVGWLVGNPNQIARVARVHADITAAAPSPFQVAITYALQLNTEYYDKLRARYFEKRERLCAVLEDLGFEFIPPAGAFYVLARAPRYHSDSSSSLANWLLNRTGVAGAPGRLFFTRDNTGSDFVRLCFARSPKVLDEAIRRFGRIVLR